MENRRWCTDIIVDLKQNDILIQALVYLLSIPTTSLQVNMSSQQVNMLTLYSPYDM